MPMYDFKCTRCVAVREVFLSIKEHNEKKKVYCDDCGAAMYQMLATPAIVNRANLRIAKSHRRQRII